MVASDPAKCRPFSQNKVNDRCTPGKKNQAALRCTWAAEIKVRVCSGTCNCHCTRCSCLRKKSERLGKGVSVHFQL